VSFWTWDIIRGLKQKSIVFCLHQNNTGWDIWHILENHCGYEIELPPMEDKLLSKSRLLTGVIGMFVSDLWLRGSGIGDPVEGSSVLNRGR
jgi:hypothetical protein